MKIYYKEVDVVKGAQTSKIHILAELCKDINHLFETIKNTEASPADKIFGCDTKTVSTDNYRFKLTIEKYDQ